MYRKIIVGHDLHAGGRDALALGNTIAAATGAELVMAGVFPFGGLPRGFEARWREQEEQVAAGLQHVADAAGATAEAFPSSSPAEGLDRLAEELGADLVVVGSSRHSRVGQAIAGHVGRNLLHGAPCAVAVAPKGYDAHEAGALTRIVVGVDGSGESRLALDDAVELARASGAQLKLVAVAGPPQAAVSVAGGYYELTEAIEESLRGALGDAQASIPAGLRREATLVAGDPVGKLAEAARGSSLLVLGSRAYGPLRRVLLGSVSSALVNDAPCPVLVRPRPIHGIPARLTAGRAA